MTICLLNVALIVWSKMNETCSMTEHSASTDKVNLNQNQFLLYHLLIKTITLLFY